MRSTHRSRRKLAAVSLAALLLLFALPAAFAGAAPAGAAPLGASSAGVVPHETAVGSIGPVVADGNAVVQFHQDYTLPEGRTVRSVVVIRGNALIAGTVLRSVVVVDGNATIESTAVIGAGLDSQASSVVVVDGHLTTEPGAMIHGKTVQVAGFPFGSIARGAASSALVRPVGVFSGWWQLLFLPIVALVVSALFPHTLRRVGDRVRLRFWPSLGWGLLGLLLTGVLLVVLTITIIGLIIVVPAVIVLLATLPFCLAAVAALLGRLALSSSARYRDNAVITAVAGAVLVSLVAIVPVIGGLAVFVATATGFGAALFLVDEWRRERRKGPSPAPGWPQAPAAWPQAQSGPQAAPPGWAGPQGWGPPPGAPPQGWGPPPGAPSQGWGPQGGMPPSGTAPEWPGSPGWAPTPPPPGWTGPQGSAPPPGPPPATDQSAAAEPTPPAPPAGDESGDLSP
jgi:hypothetical protein